MLFCFQSKYEFKTINNPTNNGTFNTNIFLITMHNIQNNIFKGTNLILISIPKFRSKIK